MIVDLHDIPASLNLKLSQESGFDLQQLSGLFSPLFDAGVPFTPADISDLDTPHAFDCVNRQNFDFELKRSDQSTPASGMCN